MNKFYPSIKNFMINEAVGDPPANSKALVNSVRIDNLDEVTAPDGTVIDMKQLIKDVEEIRTLIVAQDKLYAPYVHQLETVYTWAVPTMATDGSFLFINPAWTNTLDFNTKAFIIYHELMHCLLDHGKRQKMGNYEPSKFNEAADYEINAILVDTIDDITPEVFKGPAGGLYNPKWLNVAAEAIYDQLPPVKKRSSGGGSGSGSGPGSGSGSGSGQPGSQTDEDLRLQKEVESQSGSAPGAMISPELGRIIAKAAGLTDEEIKEAEKTPGDWNKMSKNLLERALESGMKTAGGGAGNSLCTILGNYHNSVINWKGVLSRYVGDILSKTESRWTLPNRRYSAQNPDTIRIRQKFQGKKMNRIIVCMDTSGSMERKLLQSIIDEINAILKSRKAQEIVVLFFDATIKEPQVISGNKKAYCPEVVGGGGTDFQVPLDYIKSKYKDQLSLCLFFTDGFEHIPKKPKYADKFIWIVYDNPNWPHSEYVGDNPIFGKILKVSTRDLSNFVTESVTFVKKLVVESIQGYISK